MFDIWYSSIRTNRTKRVVNMKIGRLLLFSLSLTVLASCSNTAGANTEDPTLQLKKENTALKQQVEELQNDNKELSSKFDAFVEDYEVQRNAAYNPELYQFNTASHVIFQAMRNGDVTTLKQHVNDNVQVTSSNLTFVTSDGGKFNYPFTDFKASSFSKQNVIVLKSFNYEDNYNDFFMIYAVRSTKENPDGDYYLYLTYSKNNEGEWKLSNLSSNP